MDDFKSLFILGRQPALGLAELESLFGAGMVSPVGSHATLAKHDVSKLEFQRLGGSIKLAHVVTILQKASWKDIQQYLQDTLPAELSLHGSGKLHIGLSSYGLSISSQKLLAGGLSLKKAFARETGRSVRLVSSKNELHLSSPQVIHNGLVESEGGCEIVLVQDGPNVIIARTRAEQDIESYTLRDRERPKRDAKVGMLPPKLAQIIINLAAGSEAPAGRTVLDPFCGTGVVLQEASLMGFSVMGSDIDARMVSYSKDNLTWLGSVTNSPLQSSLVTVGDATNYTWPAPFNIVACETYLGRPFTAQPSAEMVAQTSSEVNLILKKFLQNIHAQISPGERLCVAIPAWQTAKNEFKHLPLVDQISNLGYNRVSFEHVLDKQLLYYREDQYTARQLLVLTRK